MNSVNDWNPDDGPPPTEEEREDARRLADSLAHGPAARPADPDTAALVSTALRVRATTRPVDDHAAEAVRRALRTALEADRPMARVLRLRWGVAAAVAAAGVLAIAVRLRENDGPHRGSLAISLPPAFTEAVQPGAGALPSSRLYERRLRRYRAAYLRGVAP